MSKIISKQDADECRSWALPEVDQGEADSGNSMLTASQIESLQQQAYDEAYQVGLAEGRAEARAQVQQQLQQVEVLMQSLAQPFAELDQQVDDELVALVISLVRQMTRREIKSDPGQIMAVIREAMAALPVASRDLQLHLHPEDAAMVKQLYQMNDEVQAWRVVDDPLISRGGCKVITDVTQVDATLETRLNKLFAKVFGERQQDSEQ